MADLYCENCENVILDVSGEVSTCGQCNGNRLAEIRFKVDSVTPNIRDWQYDVVRWMHRLDKGILNLSGVKLTIRADCDGELEEGAVEFDEWVLLEPQMFDVPTIAGHKPARGFGLAYLVYYPGTYHAPPESDVVPVEKMFQLPDAVIAAIRMVVDNELDATLTHYHETQLAQELEEPV